jgi:hypothetical protein
LGWHVPQDEGKEAVRNGSLFKTLLSYAQSGYLMGAGSPAGSDSEANASPYGIVQGTCDCDFTAGLDSRPL